MTTQEKDDSKRNRARMGTAGLRRSASVESRRGRARYGLAAPFRLAAPWVLGGLIGIVALLGACTQETQNEIGRAVQNWTGTDGVLEVYAGEKLVKRFMQIDKLTTASGTGSREARPYRFGYGILDVNLNGTVDPGEKKVYFEFSDYSTSYIFFENPR